MITEETWGFLTHQAMRQLGQGAAELVGEPPEATVALRSSSVSRLRSHS